MQGLAVLPVLNLRKIAARHAQYLLIAQGELQPLLPLHGGTNAHTYTGEGARAVAERIIHVCFGIEPRNAIVRPPKLSKS